MTNKIIFILLLLILSGCTGKLTCVYDSDGKIIEIEGKGNIDAEVKQNKDGTVMYRMNNKTEILPKEFISVAGAKTINE